MHRSKISIIPSVGGLLMSSSLPNGNEKSPGLFLAKLEEIIHLG